MSLVTPLSRSSSATSESTSSRDSARTNLIALLSSALREPYSAPGQSSRTSGPGAQIVALCGRELVDLHAERFELEARDLAVDPLRHRMHAGGELARMAHEVL